MVSNTFIRLGVAIWQREEADEDITEDAAGDAVKERGSRETTERRHEHRLLPD